MEKKPKVAPIQTPWYLGGCASITAVMFTHPLDTIKVQLQTQQKVQFGFIGMAKNIVKTSGPIGLYSGISASMLRQATYSTARFSFYEQGKDLLVARAGTSDIPFYQKIGLAGLSGALGGVVGNPADLANVRMQNDSKLEPSQRRNYKHVGEAIVRIIRTEGPMRLMAGVTMTATRGLGVTVGQLAFYDEIKAQLLNTGFFKDNMVTHFTASVTAGCVATTITMPLDVLKTRLMNAKPGEYPTILHCLKDVLKVGPSGLFKGFVPAFVRLGPHTVLMFVILEQFKKVYLTLKAKEPNAIAN